MHGHRGRGERQAGILLDLTHLILGIAIVVLAVLSFINPEGNHMLFPLVFLLAALLNAVSSLFFPNYLQSQSLLVKSNALFQIQHIKVVVDTLEGHDQHLLFPAFMAGQAGYDAFIIKYHKCFGKKIN